MAETKKEKPIPIRIRIIRQIELLLSRIEKGKGLHVERLIAEYMRTEGIPRRVTLECINAVKFSGFGEFIINGDKERIIRKRENQKIQDVI